MAGAEIQANALDTVLPRVPASGDAAAGWTWLLIVLLGMVAPVASLRLSPLPSLAIAIGLRPSSPSAVAARVQRGLIVPFVYPLGALVCTTVGALAPLCDDGVRARARA